MTIDDGEIAGLFLIGQNPAVGRHDTRFVRRALANLDWRVVRDAFEAEDPAQEAMRVRQILGRAPRAGP
jgi:formate dehydrogenase major subunit